MFLRKRSWLKAIGKMKWCEVCRHQHTYVQMVTKFMTKKSDCLHISWKCSKDKCIAPIMCLLCQVYAWNPSTRMTPRYSKTFLGGNLSAAWLKSEMTELERRQSQYRPFHKCEAKIPADTEHLKVPVIDGKTTAPTWK